MSIKHELRKLFWKIGIDVSRFNPSSHPMARRKQILESNCIDLVLDVGANIGQFAFELRNYIGYSKKIVSFEPLSSAFQKLKINANKDSQWEIFNFALGDVEEKIQINIADNSQSSSILNMLPAHINAAPESKYIGKEEIEVRKLDSIFDEICPGNRHIYLKIDTQGFESKVIKGAEKSLSKIDTVQMEMSLVPLYKDQILFSEMNTLMTEKGYSLISIEPGFANAKNGHLLQLDGIFQRQ